MPIHADLDDRNGPADHVERCRRDFEATGNPLHAWEAWGVVRATWRGSGPRTFTRTLSEPNAAGERRLSLTWHTPLLERLEIPDWLGDYLDHCAGNLIGVQAKHRPTPSTAGRALGFPGSLATARKRWGGPFDAHEQLALTAIDRMWDEGLSVEAVANKMRGASRAAVWRAISGAKRYALRVMRDRLRDEQGSAPPFAEVPLAYSALCASRSRKPRAKKSQKRRSKSRGRM